MAMAFGMYDKVEKRCVKNNLSDYLASIRPLGTGGGNRD